MYTGDFSQRRPLAESPAHTETQHRYRLLCKPAVSVKEDNWLSHLHTHTHTTRIQTSMYTGGFSQRRALAESPAHICRNTTVLTNIWNALTHTILSAYGNTQCSHPTEFICQCTSAYTTQPPKCSAGEPYNCACILSAKLFMNRIKHTQAQAHTHIYHLNTLDQKNTNKNWLFYQHV